jgi:hypothetical protein
VHVVCVVCVAITRSTSRKPACIRNVWARYFYEVDPYDKTTLKCNKDFEGKGAGWGCGVVLGGWRFSLISYCNGTLSTVVLVKAVSAEP